jgi:hypothetical protein
MAAISAPARPTALPPLGSIKGVLFDIDGTLCDSDPLHYRAFREILLEKGYKVRARARLVRGAPGARAGGPDPRRRRAFGTGSPSRASTLTSTSAAATTLCWGGSCGRTGPRCGRPPRRQAGCSLRRCTRARLRGASARPCSAQPRGRCPATSCEAARCHAAQRSVGAALQDHSCCQGAPHPE